MLKLPAFSYSIEKGKMGFGFFFIHNETSYYKFSSYESLPNPDSNIITTDIYSIGLTAHYRVFERKWIRINSMIGLTYHWYKATCLESWSVMNRNPDFTWYEPHFYSQKESKLGGILGLNVDFPIYKGIYANTNIRYSLFPTAKYNKQNLIWEIGIGYLLYRK